ncbi:hypothetical protein MD537_27220, partial [Flavihumibacter sediminis]|nr:hypothetical protein [Flavihumibacter sediminis]
RTLLSLVVKKLSLQASFTKQGKVKNTEIYGENSPLSLTLYEPDSVKQYYTGTVTLSQSGMVEYLGQVYPLDSLVRSPFGIIRWKMIKPWNASE